MLDTNNYKSIKIDNSLNYDFNRQIPKINIVKKKKIIGSGKKDKIDFDLEENEIDNLLDKNDNLLDEINNDDNSSVDQIIDSDESPLEINTGYESISNYLKIGNKFKIIYGQNDNIIEGFITYIEIDKFEISNKNGIVEEFTIQDNKIENINKIFLLELSRHSGYINFMNLKANNLIKIYSHQKEYNEKVGILQEIDGNQLKIVINDTLEELIINVEHGISIKENIYRLEAIPEIKFERDQSDEIQFIEDSNILVNEESIINEDNYILSKIESNEILTNELMSNLYRENIYEKYRSVREIVINISELLDKNIDKSHLHSTKKNRKKIFLNTHNNYFRNGNIVPLISIKHIIYDDRVNLDHSETEHVFIKSDQKYRNYLYEINEHNQKGNKKYEFLSYNNYLTELNSLFLPSIIDNSNNSGYETNVIEDTEFYCIQPSKPQFLISRFLGREYIPLERVISPEIDSNNNIRYRSNFWQTSNHYELSKIYNGDLINVCGFIVIPDYLLNFNIVNNQINLIDLNKKKYNQNLNKFSSDIKKSNPIYIYPNTKTKINYKKNKITKIIFKNFSTLDKQEYNNILDQISPSIINLISKNQKKKITSLEDVNKLLIAWNLNIIDLDYKQISPLIEIINNNLSKINIINNKVLINEYHHKNIQIVKEYKKQNESKIIIDDSILQSATMEDIYGKYPYFNSLNDCDITRLDWIINQNDNGIYFFSKYFNIKDLDQQNLDLEITTNQDKIKDIQKDILNLHNKIEDYDLKTTKCHDILISKIFDSISDLKKDISPKINKYCILVTGENYQLYKGFKYDKYEEWISLEPEYVNNINEIKFEQELYNEHKSLITKIQKNNKNNCLENKYANSPKFIKPDNQKSIIKEINNFKYQILEYSAVINYLENINDNLLLLNRFIKHIEISKNNMINKNKYRHSLEQLELDNSNQNIITSQIKKDFDALTSLDNLDDRNKKIFWFINNKLREANPDEDQDFLYNPDSNEKIAPIDWKLEVLITIEPEKANFYSKQLIYKYGKKYDGYFRSILDGRQLFPVEYDDFMGYENENGEASSFREMVTNHDYDADTNLDSKLKKYNKEVEKYEIDNIVMLLQFNFLQSINNLSPLKLNDKLFIYENVLNNVEDYLKSDLIKKIIRDRFKKKYNRSYDTSNKIDRINLQKIQKEHLLSYTIKKTISLFTIIIQSAIPQYSIRVIKIKNCQYSLDGYPSEKIDYSDDSLLKYIVNILRHYSNNDLEGNKILNMIKINKSDESFFEAILKDYNWWYNVNSEIKLRYLEYIKKKEYNKVNLSDNKIWEGFKPNPNFYNKVNNNINKFLKDLDNNINENKMESITINKYSTNCCLDLIRNSYYNLFLHNNKNNFSNTFNNLTNQLNKNNNQTNLNIIYFDDYYSESDIFEKIKINNIDIYPSLYTKDLAVKLFSKYTDQGIKRHVDLNEGTCLITGEKSQLFLFEYNKDITVNDYQGKKFYDKYKKNLTNSLNKKKEIFDKENINLVEPAYIEKYLLTINKKNIIDIDIKETVASKDNLKILYEIYNLIESNPDIYIIKDLVDSLKSIENDWDILSNKDKRKFRDSYFERFINKQQNHISLIQKSLVERIHKRLDSTEITFNSFIDIDENAYLIFKDSHKNVYRQYVDIIMVNLSKFISCKPNDLNIPKNWSISSETQSKLETTFSKNSKIYSLLSVNNDYSAIKEIFSSILSVYSKIFSKLEILNYNSNSLINEIRLPNDLDEIEYFDIYKFFFYMILNQLIKFRHLSLYNDLSVNFFIIIFDQIFKIKNLYNKTALEVNNEIIDLAENERQIHIRRRSDLNEEQKKIDNEFKKYRLGEFYGLQGKEEWERGLSKDKNLENENYDELFKLNTKIDKSSEYSEIQTQYYEENE